MTLPMTELPLQIIELEHDNYHILIDGQFDNGITANWIIDTGASKSVLDINLNSFYESIESDDTEDYQSAGINRGMMETSLGIMSNLSFGDLEITGHKVALIDLTHVNEIYGQYTAHRIAGLLGGDVLMEHQCLIDYARKIIQFQK